eukprot:TRINITY_DN67056_c5_g5_i2.p1 TRINITY_DN67056_c5_g5~~TRINITY_DN67056_c5_g5_i2.p1  ORF type:complete len:445 (+),score=182.59 TRINITY_DN67056_c5_g5_i2:102-1436(+)
MMMMMMVKKVVVVLVVLSCVAVGSEARSIGNQLKANFFALVDLPLSASQAKAMGWSEINPDGQCDSNYGHVYRYGKRLSPAVLFDHLGQVAGIQFAVDTRIYPLYPGSSLKSPPAFPSKHEKHIWVFTAHFSDPSKLCAGATVLPGDSIGDRVWSRKSEAGNGPEHFEPLPLRREDIDTTQGWVASGCMVSGDFAHLTMYGMGQHYWRYCHPHMRSTDFYPWFLLFDQNDDLNMFGVSLSGPLPTWPTPSGKQENDWKKDPVATGDRRKLMYPHANTSELWTYPTNLPQNSLVPFFHFRHAMPLNSLWMNTLNPDKPGGMGSTSTMHIVIRDSSNVTRAACARDADFEPYDYSQKVYGDVGPGKYDLAMAQKAEEELAAGFATPTPECPRCDEPHDFRPALVAITVLWIATLFVLGVVVYKWRLSTPSRGVDNVDYDDYNRFYE